MADQPNPPDLEVEIPIPQGLKVSADQSYHLLVVGNLAGSDEGSISGPLASALVSVNAKTFDEVMAAAAPSVNFTTTDPLTAKGAMVEVTLRFDSIKAFHPTALGKQIAATRSLLAIRGQVANRMRGKVSSQQLDQAVVDAISSDSNLAWLADSLKWSQSSPAADPGTVDNLLGQIDLGGDSEEDSGPPPKSPIGSVVAAAAADGASIDAEEAAAVRRTLKEIDRRVNVWLNAVLHAPQVQSLEAAWRSLAFLVSRMEFRKGLRLTLLHAPAKEMLARFRTMVIDPVFDEGAQAPDLIVIDRQFGNTATDMDDLDEFAQHAASLPAMALAGASSQFLGVKHAWQIATLPTVGNLLSQWQFAKWKTLREQPYARSLGVILGRCLLRAPHDAGDIGDLDFGFKEAGSTDKDFCWASGAVAAATSVVRSVADVGWPTAMAGFVHGRVEGFATAMGGKKGEKKFGPSDTTLTQAKIEELALVSINAAAGVTAHDDVLIWNGLTAARPQRGDPDAFLEISLPYQLFAGRLSALLLLLKPHLSGMSADKVAPFVTQHIREWIKFDAEPSPEQLNVQTRPCQEAPGTLELAVTVTPPQNVLPGSIPIVMGYQVK